MATFYDVEGTVQAGCSGDGYLVVDFEIEGEPRRVRVAVRDVVLDKKGGFSVPYGTQMEYLPIERDSSILN